ncbi:Glutathione S-transferase 1 [Eumeta japonica]|uniref:Glutathione S-transferase 1 n=1 Tax=Eumeta variegata TaxID=151549 RepID=A0A4C1TWS6_EUMVA|nr:Glutathione S-transferase 1 [Eumeta japonica]
MVPSGRRGALHQPIVRKSFYATVERTAKELFFRCKSGINHKMPLTLYKLDASPPARAAMMAAKALNIKDIEYIDINLLEGHHLKDEYTKLNPQHTVPTLVDGDFAIWDSHAIATYLVSEYGADDSLYPAEPKSRALVDQRLHFDSGILFPSCAHGGEKAFIEENLKKIEKAYDFLEKFLTQNWIAGDNFTVADICCGATTSSLDLIVPIAESKYPNITAWLKRCAELDLFKETNEPGNKALGGLIKTKVG